jgi:hypothetical protein
MFAGQTAGIKQVSERIWLVGFMDYDLGYFDHETCRLEPIEIPTEGVTYASGINWDAPSAVRPTNSLQETRLLEVIAPQRTEVMADPTAGRRLVRLRTETCCAG